jgi:hypothetical protein
MINSAIGLGSMVSLVAFSHLFAKWTNQKLNIDEKEWVKQIRTSKYNKAPLRCVIGLSRR